MTIHDATIDLPEEIERAIRGYESREFHRRQAPSRIFMLDHPERLPLILKVARELKREAERIEWLKGKLPVPEVIAIETLDSFDFLLMTRLEGIDGTDAHETMGGQRFIECLAQGLQEVHSLPTTDCPFVTTVDDLIEFARQRVEMGKLAAEHFPPGYLGRSPEDLFDSLCQLRPVESEMVFTHGDASLPNFLFNDDAISGYIDLGQAAVTDRYRDLGDAARSITRNMGGRWVRLFFEAYGAPMDDQRVEFFILLDHFVMDRPD
jgi:kanamycin kinase/aminoglycoside 3'-phosphotransferase-2